MGPDDFIAVELTDTTPIPNVMQRLKTRFPKVIELTRVNPLTVTLTQLDTRQVQNDPLALLQDFFEQTTQHPLDDQQLHWAKQALQRATKEDAK